TWMLPAMTSVRLESSAGTCDSHGIHSTLMFFTPSQSRTPLLISQSMPLAALVFSSRMASGGFCDRPSVIPSFTALASEPSPQLSNIGLVSKKNVISSAIADLAASAPTKPMARARRKYGTTVQPPCEISGEDSGVGSPGPDNDTS